MFMEFIIAQAIQAEREAQWNRANTSQGLYVEKPSLVGRFIAALQATRIRETTRQTSRPLARNSSVAK